jgi:hypothetical protein
MSRATTFYCCWVIGLFSCASVSAQAPVEVHGEVEAGYVLGRYEGETVGKNHFDRVLVNAESGSFSVQASYFFYPFCDFNMVEESYLAYEQPKFKFRFGRLREEVGQSNWYDDWDSGLIFLAEPQHHAYFGTYSPWLTEPGADCKINLGTGSLTVGAGESRTSNNLLAPSRFDHLTSRLQTEIHGVVAGLGAYVDSSNPSYGNQLYAADVRYGKDRWLFRAQADYSHSQTGEVFNGFFVDAFYRPPAQDKLTLVARFQTFEDYEPEGASRPTGETIGAKYVLPADFVLDVNYNQGNFPWSMGFSQGWLFQLQKTYRF